MKLIRYRKGLQSRIRRDESDWCHLFLKLIPYPAGLQSGNSGKNLLDITNPLLMAGFCMMLTKEDENFLKYWSEQRQKKKPFFGMASVGLRLGVFVAIGIALSLVAATYNRKANPVLHNYSSIVITVIIAGLAIVLFVTYFSGQHKWDQNELHYQELLRKKSLKENMQQ